MCLVDSVEGYLAGEVSVSELLRIDDPGILCFGGQRHVDISTYQPTALFIGGLQSLSSTRAFIITLIF